MTQLFPFLMFEGQAEEALNFYVDNLPSSRITDLVRWQSGSHGEVGKIKLANAEIIGVPTRFSDSPAKHGFTFTPSLSLFVECVDADLFGNILEKLSGDAKFLMPRGNYGFSKEFCWLNDRYGVSWQINLK